MRKPNNYDSVAASLSFEPLALGGHPCIIKGVEEAKSKAGRDMIKVALDIAPDNQRLHINSEAIEPGRKANFVLANVLKPQKSIAQFEHAWVAGVQVQ